MTHIAETTIPSELLKEASEDPELHKWSVPTDEHEVRMGIYDGDELIGFFSPVSQEYDGHTYWRTGTIYIAPRFRKKGHAAAAIDAFFELHPYGLAHVRKDNFASMMTYTKCGFHSRGSFVHSMNGKEYLILTREPEELSTESLSSKW